MDRGNLKTNQKNYTNINTGMLVLHSSKHLSDYTSRKLLELTRRRGRESAAPPQLPRPRMRSQTRLSSWLQTVETKGRTLKFSAQSHRTKPVYFTLVCFFQRDFLDFKKLVHLCCDGLKSKQETY